MVHNAHQLSLKQTTCRTSRLPRCAVKCIQEARRIKIYVFLPEEDTAECNKGVVRSDLFSLGIKFGLTRVIVAEWKSFT